MVNFLNLIGQNRRRLIICSTSFLFLISFLCIIWAISSFKIHDFQGKCSMCHVNIPDKDSKAENLIFVADIDKLCEKCHIIDKGKSHPINIRPNKDIPLAIHLDKDGRMTCTTCHDVHKPEKTSNKYELQGLLWGHAKGKEFCFICHNKEALDITWRHQSAVAYAHPSGKLTENANGGLLDKFSIECLSCHDGTLSKFPQVEIKQGLWKHGIGMSHPIGIDYPRSTDFTPPEALPKEIRLFYGKVGCLSCHEIYNKENNMLAMENKRSRLCLACHRK